MRGDWSSDLLQGLVKHSMGILRASNRKDKSPVVFKGHSDFVFDWLMVAGSSCKNSKLEGI